MKNKEFILWLVVVLLSAALGLQIIKNSTLISCIGMNNCKMMGEINENYSAV